MEVAAAVVAAARVQAVAAVDRVVVPVVAVAGHAAAVRTDAAKSPSFQRCWRSPARRARAKLCPDCKKEPGVAPLAVLRGVTVDLSGILAR
jgi:hypothetical protein